MSLNHEIVASCRKKLTEVARSYSPERNCRPTIYYGELAIHLGVANQGVGKYLTEIYEQLRKSDPKAPDLTVVAVYKQTDYGCYNSRGGPSRSVRVDSNDAVDRKQYDNELSRVYAYDWSNWV